MAPFETYAEVLEIQTRIRVFLSLKNHLCLKLVFFKLILLKFQKYW